MEQKQSQVDEIEIDLIFSKKVYNSVNINS